MIARVAGMTLDLALTRMPVRTCSLGELVWRLGSKGVEVMCSADHDPVGRDRLTATRVELPIRLGVFGLLLFSRSP